MWSHSLNHMTCLAHYMSPNGCHRCVADFVPLKRGKIYQNNFKSGHVESCRCAKEELVSVREYYNDDHHMRHYYMSPAIDFIDIFSNIRSHGGPTEGAGLRLFIRATSGIIGYPLMMIQPLGATVIVSGLPVQSADIQAKTSSSVC